METLNRRRRPSTAAGLVDGVPVEPQQLTTSPQPRRGSLSPHNGDGTGRQQQAALLSASAAVAARPRGGTAGPWLTEAAGVGVPPERGDFAWVGRLLKRRSGFGKIAAKNWRARCFCATRNGLLLYYEEDTFELVDFSQPPRGVVNLMEGDCTLTTGRMDTDMPTQFPLVIREVGRREQRWKLCAQSQEDLTSLEQVLSDFFKEGASDQRLRSHRRGSKMWSMLPRANSSFSMVGGGSFEGDSQHAGRDVTPGSPAAHFKPALSPLACSPDVRSSRTRRGSLQLSRGGGGGAAGWAERHRGAVYFATLLVVNGSVIALHWLQPPLWGAWFLAAVAAINLAVALGAPQRHDEASPEGAARRVPLVHAHDLPPLVNAVKMMQFTNKNRQALREKQAQADGGGSISPGESFRELPLAGTTVVRAVGKVAGDLTAPQRTWQDGIGSVFNVRGASYLTDRVKAPSVPALYTMVGCDFYATPLRVSNVADAYVSLKDLAAQAPVPPIPDVPGLLVINCQLPSNPPEVFNYSEDGPSYHVILYFAITQETADALKDLSTASPAVKLWARYSTKQADDDEFRGRFKAMCVVENWEATGLSNSFRVYNGKPVLITRTGQTFAGKPATAGGAACLEMDINIHRFRYAAKKVLHNLMEKFQQMVLHVGFTIEGRSADELPEAMLACACLNYGSPDEVDELQTGLDED